MAVNVDPTRQLRQSYYAAIEEELRRLSLAKGVGHSDLPSLYAMTSYSSGRPGVGGSVFGTKVYNRQTNEPAFNVEAVYKIYGWQVKVISHY